MISEQWLAFFTVALVTTLTPGPALLFTMQNALTAGRKPALAGAMGNACGLLLVAALVFAGVGLMLMQFPLAFQILKGLGAAYLIYLAWLQWQQVRVLRRQQAVAQFAPATVQSGWFKRGVGVALTNPKAWLFISALFPQFIDAAAPAAAQFAGLALIFAGCSLLAHGFWLQLVRASAGVALNPIWRSRLGQAQALLLALVGLSLCWTTIPT